MKVNVALIWMIRKVIEGSNPPGFIFNIVKMVVENNQTIEEKWNPGGRTQNLK